MHTKFIFPPQPPLAPVSLAECKKHCTCGLSPYALFVKALESINSAEAAKFRIGDKIDKDKIVADGARLLMTPDPVRFDPLFVILTAYRDYCLENFDWCLEHKASPSDCIYGCYSGVTDGKNNRIHSHQRRPYYLYKDRKGFEKIAFKVSRKDFLNGVYEKFEDLQSAISDADKAVEKEIGTATGFGKLAVYDAALRFASHSDDPESLLPTMVYLHSGPSDAAIALKEISDMTDKSILREPVVNKSTETIAPENFTPRLVGGIAAHHIENLLCIFHDMFERWEAEIRNIKNLPQRKEIKPFRTIKSKTSKLKNN